MRIVDRLPKKTLKMIDDLYKCIGKTEDLINRINFDLKELEWKNDDGKIIIEPALLEVVEYGLDNETYKSNLTEILPFIDITGYHNNELENKETDNEN